MAKNYFTLVELLAEVAGAQLEFEREDEMLSVAIVKLPPSRLLIAMERTYRDGFHMIFDPMSEELALAREGDLWKLWNCERGKGLFGVVERNPHL